MIFWKHNKKDRRIDLPSHGHTLLREARLAKRAGDFILAAQLCEQAIHSYRSLIRLRPLDFRSREGLRRAWEMPILLFPDPGVFPKPMSRQSQQSFVEKSSFFVRITQAIWTWVVNRFIEKEWCEQCKGKFGGLKPPAISWRSFYINNETFLQHNPDYVTQLGWAVEMGHLQLAESLVETHRSDDRIKIDFFPVEEAVLNGNENMVRFFLKEGLSPHLKRGSQWSLLHHAVISKSLTMVALLLAHGARPDVKDVSGLTPLFMAVLQEETEMAELLIAHGARCHETLANGLTLLAWAVYRGNLEMAELLLRHGTTLTFTHVCGFSLLHIASICGFTKIAETLIKAGQNPTAVDRFKRTPLHWAAHFGHLSVVECLCKSGSDLFQKDQYGDTALQLALENRHLRVAKFLRGIERRLSRSRASLG